jgi:hypothetical protein
MTWSRKYRRSSESKDFEVISLAGNTHHAVDRHKAGSRQEDRDKKRQTEQCVVASATNPPANSSNLTPKGGFRKSTSDASLIMESE